MQERYFMSLLVGNAGVDIRRHLFRSSHFRNKGGKDGQFQTVCSDTASRKIDRVICKSINHLLETRRTLVALRTLKENNVMILFERSLIRCSGCLAVHSYYAGCCHCPGRESFDFSKHCMEQSETVPAGNVCNKDIYGYEFRKGSICRTRTDTDTRAVFIIPEEAEIVRMVFRLLQKEELHTDRPEAGCLAYPAAEQRMQTAAKGSRLCCQLAPKGRR